MVLVANPKRSLRFLSAVPDKEGLGEVLLRSCSMENGSYGLFKKSCQMATKSLWSIRSTSSSWSKSKMLQHGDTSA